MPRGRPPRSVNMSFCIKKKHYKPHLIVISLRRNGRQVRLLHKNNSNGTSESIVNAKSVFYYKKHYKPHLIVISLRRNDYRRVLSSESISKRKVHFHCKKHYKPHLIVISSRRNDNEVRFIVFFIIENEPRVPEGVKSLQVRCQFSIIKNTLNLTS